MGQISLPGVAVSLPMPKQAFEAEPLPENDENVSLCPSLFDVIVKTARL